MKKLLFILFFFICYSTFSQSPGNDTSRYIHSPNQYGIWHNRIWGERVNNIPADTLFSKDGIARIGTKLYVGNGIYWSLAGVSIDFDTDSVTLHWPYICVWEEGFPICANLALEDTVVAKAPLNVLLKETTGALYDTLQIKGSGIDGQYIAATWDTNKVEWRTLPGGGGGIESVTGDLVDNTDPVNPIVNTPTLQQAWEKDSTAFPQILTGANSFTIQNTNGGFINFNNNALTLNSKSAATLEEAFSIYNPTSWQTRARKTGETRNTLLDLTKAVFSATANGTTGNFSTFSIDSTKFTLSALDSTLIKNISLVTDTTINKLVTITASGKIGKSYWPIVGGGGVTLFSDLDDVTWISPLNNQIPVWNSGTGKLENQTPVLFDLAGTEDNDYLQLNLSLNKWQNRRTTYAATSAVLKMMVVDTTTGLFYRTEVPTLANDSWALAGNAATSANFLGTTNNTSVNFRQNNERYHQMDSLGGFNSFPPAGNTNVYTAYRNASTTNYAYRLSVESSEAIIRTINSALIFKTNYNSGAGQLENFRLTESVTGATRASLPQAILTGKLQAKIALPSGTEISNAIDIANTTPVVRYSLGLDVNNDAVFSLNNVGWRLYQSNDAASGYAFGAGDYMRVFNETGNVMIKNKGTYTQDTSSRFSIISDRQGTLPAPVMTTTKKLGITSGMVGGQITAGGSGYVNATYSQVPFTGGTGTGARAFDVTVAGGAVTAVNMSSNSGRGANYTNGDVLSISNANLGGSGSGFQYTVTLLTDSSTAKGLQVYDSTLKKLCWWDGSVWQTTGTGSGSGDALVANPLSQFAATSSAQLAGTISDESGTDKLVYNTNTTLVTPTLGVASSTSESITGTAGAGFLQIANQSSTPSTPTTSGRIYFNNTNALSWIGTNGFTRTFDGTANTANRTYTLPDSSGRIALMIDSPSHTYAGVPTFTAGTAPSGATTHSYRWSKVGHTVTLRINLAYATAGATVTVAFIPMPTDCPTPEVPAGHTTNDYIFIGEGNAGTLTSSAPSSIGARTALYNAATPELRMLVTSGAYKTFYLTIIYFTP